MKIFKIIRKEDGVIADMVSAEDEKRAWWLVIFECNFEFKIQESTEKEWIDWVNAK